MHRHIDAFCRRPHVRFIWYTVYAADNTWLTEILGLLHIVANAGPANNANTDVSALAMLFVLSAFFRTTGSQIIVNNISILCVGNGLAGNFASAGSHYIYVYVTGKNVSEMTYNVSSGTLKLNSTIPYLAKMSRSVTMLLTLCHLHLYKACAMLYAA